MSLISNLDAMIALRREVYEAQKQNDQSKYWNLIYNSDVLVESTVEYDANWANGTGYLNGAVNAKLPGEIGAVIRCRVTEPNNRRILMVKTTFGNVVVFERYTPGEDATVKGPITMNIPAVVGTSEMIGSEGALSFEQLNSIFGFDGYTGNVGVRLQRFAESVADGGCHQTLRRKLRRCEAMLILSVNASRIFEILRESATPEYARAELMLTAWYADSVALMYKGKGVKYEKFGIQPDGYYKLTATQADTIINTSFTQLTAMNSDKELNNYYGLFERVQDVSFQEHEVDEV